MNRVDFFNMLDTKFTTISSRVASGQEFYVIVANAQLSTLTALEINGIRYSTPNYQANAQKFLNGGGGLLPTFTLDAGNPLSQFALAFRADAITSGGLIATQTGCVRANDAGASGEYRDGALTIQILDAATASLDGATGAASTGLLWESTVFWHKDGVDCY